MPAYSILAVTPVTESWIADYVPTTSALIAKHGGKYLARTASHETLEGDGQLAALRIIIEWPSREAAHTFVTDPDYLPQLQARTDGSLSHHVLIAGIDDMAT